MTILEQLQNKAPATELTDLAKAQTLRAHLDLIMSQIDYTHGACAINSPIGILIKPDYLESVRKALELTK